MQVRRFKLSDQFIDPYRTREVPWGPLGYITYKRTYARRLNELDPTLDGTEEWHQTCRRVIEGMFNIQKQHCGDLNLPWNDKKAQRTAQEAYDRLFVLKWTPPGRGLWMMGTKFVEEKTGAGLFNCAFKSTKDLKEQGGYIFRWIMDALMLGVGVGFDTLGAGTVVIKQPGSNSNNPRTPEERVNTYSQAGDLLLDGPAPWTCTLQDSREGWVEATQVLLDAFFFGNALPSFDYELVRPAGQLIKGFGGTSSGPGPLIDLHKSLTKLLTSKIGQPITAVDIVDIENLIGKCVVAGNVRRSAALALGSGTDFDYLTMKNDKELLHSHRWGSNNSIDAKLGMDYTWHARQSTINGEPGYIWLENARTRGRFKDPIRLDDLKVMGFNPCVTGDTWIATNLGYYQVNELVGNPHWKAKVDGKSYDLESNGFFETGVKKVFRLTTTEGLELKLTADHKVLTTNGFKEAKDLTTNDQIVVSNNRNRQINRTIDSVGSEGYLMGLLVGDGTFADNEAVISVWDPSLVESVTSSLTTLSIDTATSFIEERNEWRFRKKAISVIAESYDIKQGSKHQIDHLANENPHFIVEFLSGLFDADGTVIGNTLKGTSIRLSQNKLELLKTVQRMLLGFGIFSIIYQNRKPEGNYNLPDGQGGYKLYTCKAMHELVISNDNLPIFRDTIGFKAQAKKDRLDSILSSYKRKLNKTKWTVSFEDLQYVGEEPVYDVTVKDLHAFDANGIVVHNCSEQQLEDMEMCCLTETFPFKHDSLEDYQRTLKIAYLYAKTVTLAKTHWSETNAIMLKNRRIGLSMSGIVQALDKLGKNQFFTWCDKSYTYLQDLDAVYSDWLCIPRSKRTTSIKPSGTVSLLNGSTPGMHWAEDEYYIRRIRFAEDSDIVPKLIEAGYPVEKDTYSPNTLCVSFPVKEEQFTRGKREVSMWEQLELAAQLQYYWADNAVSVTITFKPDEASSIKHALDLYQTRLKAVSFLRYEETGYVQAPYEPITKELYEELSEKITPIQYLVTGQAGAGTKYCDGDSCTI